jgi:hypothetical protein
MSPENAIEYALDSIDPFGGVPQTSLQDASTGHSPGR